MMLRDNYSIKEFCRDQILNFFPCMLKQLSSSREQVLIMSHFVGWEAEDQKV